MHVLAQGHGLLYANGARGARRLAIAAAEARLLAHHGLAVFRAELQRILRAHGFSAFLAVDAFTMVNGCREIRRRETVAHIARGVLAQVHGGATARAAEAYLHHVAHFIVAQAPYQLLQFHP